MRQHCSCFLHGLLDFFALNNLITLNSSHLHFLVLAAFSLQLEVAISSPFTRKQQNSHKILFSSELLTKKMTVVGSLIVKLRALNPDIHPV